MSEGKKPIIGIDMGIDPDYLDGVVKSTVAASVSESLLGKEELARQLVLAVLERKVNPRDGKPSTYSDSISLIDYLMNKTVKDTANAVIVEELERMKEPVREMIRETLATKKAQNAICDALMDVMDNNIKSHWGIDFTVEFKKGER